MSIIPNMEIEKLDKFKATGPNRTFIVAKADGVPESYYNLKIILDSMNLHLIPHNISLCCDMKVMNIILGIRSCTSMHGCPYCEGFKVDDKSGKKPTTIHPLGCKEVAVALAPATCLSLFSYHL